MMVHINSNYIHLTKNKPIDWRFKPPLFATLWSGLISHYCTINAILKRQKKNSLPTFFESGGSAALPVGLPRTSRAIPEIKKPFATSFHKPSNYDNAPTFPREESQEICRRYGRFIQVNQILFSSMSLWNKPLHLLWTVLRRWTW